MRFQSRPLIDSLGLVMSNLDSGFLLGFVSNRIAFFAEGKHTFDTKIYIGVHRRWFSHRHCQGSEKTDKRISVYNDLNDDLFLTQLPSDFFTLSGTDSDRRNSPVNKVSSLFGNECERLTCFYEGVGQACSQLLSFLFQLLISIYRY